MKMKDLKPVIEKNRSYRRFDFARKIPADFLVDLVDAARMSQSAANLQPLSYMTVAEEEMVAKVHKHMRWAGYLADWSGPVDAERPVAYIVVLGNTQVKQTYRDVDAGLAMQNMCICAAAEGLGSCIIANIDRAALVELLEIPEQFEVLYALAFGYPVEKVRLVPFAGDVKYYRDSEQNHFVPKRLLKDVLIKQV
ncbi:MAG: nitroreductase [Desulfuromonas sp.]|nr:MAG: nitroreductase [Desulfuromonas sp.]